MDYRLRTLWQREAKQRYLEEKISRIQEIRIAQAEEQKYKRIMGNIETQLKLLSPSNPEEVKNNWADLKGNKG